MNVKEPTSSTINILTKWDLWSSGTTLLRGANIWQSLVLPEVDGLEFKGASRVGPPFYQKDFDDLAAMGANYVAMSVPGLFSENPPYQADPEIQQNLDNLLEMAAKADLFVTIAFRSGPGRAEWNLCCKGEPDWSGHFNDKVWEDAAAQQAWADMWRYTSERYRNNPVVAGYELMVEPNADDILLNIWNPADFYPKYKDTLYDWNQFYPKLVTAIREVDQDTPIIVGGMGYSSINWLPYLIPLVGEKIVYDVHQYAPYDVYTHQGTRPKNSYPGDYDLNGDGQPESFDKQWLINLFKPVKHYSVENKVPMAVNEYGVKRWAPNAGRFMLDQMEIFELNGWNYALWEWSTSYPPFGQSITDFNFRLGADPANHTDQVSSELMDSIRYFWQRNTLRPSKINWVQ